MGQESEEAALLIRAGKLMKNALLIPVDQLIHAGLIERIGTGEAARDLLKGEMRIPSKQLDDAGALFLTVLALAAAAERGIRRCECAAALAGVVAGGELAFSDLEDSLHHIGEGSLQSFLFYMRTDPVPDPVGLLVRQRLVIHALLLFDRAIDGI